jgi:hypothetical protein
MAYGQAFIPVANGQWVQICEYRESRVSLVAQLSDGYGVFSVRTDGPQITYNSLQMMAGLTQQVGSAALLLSGRAQAPTYLDIDLARHGDLVKQAWFVWVSPGNGTTSQTFTTSGTFVLPDGFNGMDCYSIGSGGDGAQGQELPGRRSGGGGGAGAWALSSLFPLPTGTVFTINIVATPGDNWVSITGVAPVTSADGSLATAGASAVGPNFEVPGNGGAAAGCIGAAVSGPNGGFGALNPFATIGMGGGSGGSSPLPGQAGNPFATTGGAQTGPSAFGSIGGAGGDSGVTPMTPGANGVLGGGGGGGAFQDGGGESLGGTGGLGCIVLDWTAYATGGGGGVTPIFPPSPPAGTVVTVFESFNIPDAPPRAGRFNVPLPRLSPPAIEALHALLARVQPEVKPPLQGE